MRTLTLLLLPILFSCQSQTKVVLEPREITLDGLTKDSVIVFLRGNDTLNIYREVEIIENENKDTLALGYTTIRPGFIGKIWFAQIDLNKSNAEYLDDFGKLDPSKPWSFSKLFTIGLANQSYNGEFKRITLKLKLK